MTMILQNSLIIITPLPIIARTGCMDSTSFTTVLVTITEPNPATSALSGNIVVNNATITSVTTNSHKIALKLYAVGEITGIIIGVVLIIVGLSVILAIVFTLKLKNDRHQHVKQSLKSQIR